VRATKKIIIILLCLTQAISSYALALSFQVSPAKINQAYDEREFKLPEIKVKNTSDEIADVVVIMRPLEQDLLGSAIEGSEDYAYSIDKYIRIDEKDKHTTLAPGEEHHFTPTVKLPKNYNAAGGYAMIYVETIPHREGVKKSSTGVLSTGAIGILVLLEFPDNEKTYGFDLMDVNLHKKNEEALEFTATIKNEGNILNEFGGSVEITDKQGNHIASLALKPRRILPDNKVNIYTVWTPATLPQGEIQVTYETGSPETGSKKHSQAFMITSSGQIMKLSE